MIPRDTNPPKGRQVEWFSKKACYSGWWLKIYYLLYM